ncbi:MAG: aminoglycoside phosphotransferase family protein [Acidobacteria bacterium]|nr:aminoglycoside phosphotransferase family protein [Acidobacteriota bacterium]
MSGLEALSLGRELARSTEMGPAVDPTLPILRALSTAAGAAEWCRRRLDGRDGLLPDSLEKVEILRYRPGRRCTLGLSFGGARGRRVYVKVYRPGRAERSARILSGLAALGPWPDLRVPAIVAFVPDDGVIVLEEVAGRSFEEVLGSGAGAENAARAAAGAVARLHSLCLLQARPWTADDELSVLDGRRLVLMKHPDLPWGRVDAVYHRARAAVPILDASPPVLLHRDLHPQQILLDGERGGLVDLDDVAWGPPELDLGNLLAHLDLFGAHLASDSGRFGEAERDILAAYESSRIVSEGALRAARAASLFRLAGVYAGHPGLARLAPRLLDRAEQILNAGERP